MDRAWWFWDLEYLEDDSLDLQLLMFDSETKYTVVDHLCADLNCETYLTYMLDGEEVVWIVDKVDGGGSIVQLSDTLHFVTSGFADFMATCWSSSFDGPVVSILLGGVEPSVVDRAWVFQGGVVNGTWFGLEPTMVDPSSMAAPPFSEVDLRIPVCREAAG